MRLDRATATGLGEDPRFLPGRVGEGGHLAAAVAGEDQVPLSPRFPWRTLFRS